MALTKIRGLQILEGDITNTQIGASAAIASSKLADGANWIKKDGTVALEANLSVGGFKFTNLAAPTSAADSATKGYVDSLAQGLDSKASVKVATAAALSAVTAAGSGVGKTLTADANGALSIDGISTWNDIDGDSASNDPYASNAASRVLVKNQAAGADNGIYAVKDKGSAGTPFILVRAVDFDSNTEVTAGAYVFVEEGTVNSDAGFVVITDNPITVDTTAVSFTQFTGAGQLVAGDGLTKTGNTLDVNVAAAGGIEISADNLQVKADVTGGANLALAVNLSANGVAVKIDDATIGGNGSNQLYVKASGIGADQIAPDAVGKLKINADVAGNGLSQAVGGELDVNVSSAGGLQITADELEVKLDGATLSLSASGLKIGSSVLVQGSMVTRETPSGLVNGSNAIYTLANTPVVGTESIFLNGLLQDLTNDYTISGGTITFVEAPVSNDKIRVSYMK